MVDEIENKINEIIDNKPSVTLPSKAKVFFNSHKRLIILLSILFIVLVAVGITFLPTGLKTISDMFKQDSHSPTSTASPRRIPSGPKGFTVSQADKTVPQFGRGEINPYDPAKGATQTLTITVKFKDPVTSVSAILRTDKQSSELIPLTLINGTNTDGQWQATWKITDTYLYNYALSLEAKSGKSVGVVEITLR
jgi:hypothetical protein